MDRPDRDKDGNWIYYASELGGCTKALILKRMGKVQKVSEPDSSGDPGYLARIFSEGNLHEKAVIDNLSESSPVYFQQQEIRQFFGVPGTVVIGHIDGIWRDNILEVKSMGDSSFKAFKKHLWDTPGLVQKYKWQINVYMFALEKPGILFVKNRNNGESLALPAEWWYQYNEIQERLLLIETAAEMADIPFDCDFNNFPCPYEYLHNETKVIKSDAEIDMLVNTYLDAQAQGKIHAERAASARLLLAEALGDHDKLETTGGSRIVRYGTKDNPMYRISTRQEPIDEV